MSDTLVNVAAKDEMDEAQDSDSSADYDADQDWGVAESSGRLPALLSAMVECVKEVTTDLDCLVEARPDLCAKKLRLKRVQRVEKVTALMTARTKSSSNQEPEDEEESESEEDDLGKGNRNDQRSELDNWDPNQRRSGRKLRPRKNLEYVEEEKTQPNWKVKAALDGLFRCERHPVNH